MTFRTITDADWKRELLVARASRNRLADVMRDILQRGAPTSERASDGNGDSSAHGGARRPAAFHFEGGKAPDSRLECSPLADLPPSSHFADAGGLPADGAAGDCRGITPKAEAGVGEAIKRLRNKAGWWEGDDNAREVLRQFLMNNNNITEADVIAWLHARVAEIGIPGLVLVVDSGPADYFPFVAKVDSKGAFGCGQSLAAALAMLRPRIKTAEQLAELKRRDAAKLLAEADALAPQVVPALVIQDKEGAAA